MGAAASAIAAIPAARPDSSIGTTTFEEDDDPIDFKVSRYWSCIVLRSAMLADSLIDRRLPTYLLGGFALLAMLLACAGIYGVLSLVTAKRT